MTKPQIKAIASGVVAVALALAGAYGYVDENCTCDPPVVPEGDALPVAEPPVPNPVAFDTDGYLYLLLAQSEVM